MYQYDEYDQRIVDERVEQYADQTARYLAGELSDIADHLRQRLLRVTKIAKELEDVALAVEQERESNSESLEKLSQLKTLLKGL